MSWREPVSMWITRVAQNQCLDGLNPFEFILRSRKKGMTEMPKKNSIELLQLSGSIPTSIRQSQAQASTHAASAWTILRAHWLEFGWRLNQEARKHMCQLCFVQLLGKATQPRSTCARLRGAMMPPSSDLWDATSPTDITWDIRSQLRRRHAKVLDRK